MGARIVSIEERKDDMTDRPEVVVEKDWSGDGFAGQELGGLLHSPDWATLAMADSTSMAGAFLRALELRYYPPVGPVNDLFQLFTFRHLGEGWVCCVYPLRYHGLAEQLAALFGLRFYSAQPPPVIAKNLFVLGGGVLRPPAEEAVQIITEEVVFKHRYHDYFVPPPERTV